MISDTKLSYLNNVYDLSNYKMTNKMLGYKKIEDLSSTSKNEVILSVFGDKLRFLIK
jgi:hypothetical protein